MIEFKSTDGTKFSLPGEGGAMQISIVSVKFGKEAAGATKFQVYGKVLFIGNVQAASSEAGMMEPAYGEFLGVISTEMLDLKLSISEVTVLTKEPKVSRMRMVDQ